MVSEGKQVHLMNRGRASHEPRSRSIRPKNRHDRTNRHFCTHPTFIFLFFFPRSSMPSVLSLHALAGSGHALFATRAWRPWCLGHGLGAFSLAVWVQNGFQPLQTAPAEIIFFRRWFLYSAIVPSHSLIVLFSQTRICLAILSSSLQTESALLSKNESKNSAL